MIDTFVRSTKSPGCLWSLVAKSSWFDLQKESCMKKIGEIKMNMRREWEFTRKEEDKD